MLCFVLLSYTTGVINPFFLIYANLSNLYHNFTSEPISKTLQGFVTRCGQMIRNVFAVCVEYELRSSVAHEGNMGAHGMGIIVCAHQNSLVYNLHDHSL